MSTAIYFVTSATGAQGGAVARHLLAAHQTVHFLARTPNSPASLALQDLGAKVFPGDFDNVQAINAAIAGCTGVFLNVYPGMNANDLGMEVRHAKNVVVAAVAAKIDHIVYSSTLGTGTHESFPKSTAGGIMSIYWNSRLSKHDIECIVRDSGLSWTIIRPGYHMPNMLLPRAGIMYPDLTSSGILLSAFSPSTKIALVDPDDIGKCAVIAFLNREAFNGKALDLANEQLTMGEIAHAMRKISGKEIQAKTHSKEYIEAMRDKHPLIAAQVRVNSKGFGLDPESVKVWGVQLKTFEEYLVREQNLLNTTLAAL